MKKLIISAYFMLLSISITNPIFATSNIFAKITATYSYLYKTASSKIEDNVICLLEPSYFVEITLDYDSEFYKVIYNGELGYVLKTSVAKVIGTPSHPYPTKRRLFSSALLCLHRQLSVRKWNALCCPDFPPLPLLVTATDRPTALYLVFTRQR